MADLKPGDRVSTNEAFSKMFPRAKRVPLTGVIASINTRHHPKRYNVLWDDWARPESVHVSFLQPAQGGSA